MFHGCEVLIIFPESISMPSTWDCDWNSTSRPVYWHGQWHYDANGNPQPN